VGNTRVTTDTASPTAYKGVFLQKVELSIVRHVERATPTSSAQHLVDWMGDHPASDRGCSNDWFKDRPTELSCEKQIPCIIPRKLLRGFARGLWFYWR